MLKSLTFGNVKRGRQSILANHCSEVNKNGKSVNVGSNSSLCKLFSWYRYSSRRHASFTSFKGRQKLHGTCIHNFSVPSRRNTMTNNAQLAWKRFSQMRSYGGPAFSPLKRSQHIHSFSHVLSRWKIITHPSQIAWKRFFQMHSRYVPDFTPLYRRIRVRSFVSIVPRHNSVVHHARIAWKRFSQKRSYSGSTSLTLSRGARFLILVLNKYQHLLNGIFASIVGSLALRQRSYADADEFLPIGNSLYMHAQDGHIYLTSLILSVLDGLVLLVRAIYLAFLFSPAIAMAPFADSFGVEFRKKWIHLVHVTLENAGPAFIKWGQWAATRPDLFPKDLCIELTKLHSKAPEHSFAYTKNSVETAFGRKLTELFDDFEEAPVASGSVAQVHRATLKFRYPGKDATPVVVAVKVRHPGVSESIRKDFVIIHFFAKISNFIPALKWLRLDESVQQFAVFMMSQVDLSREAAQLSRFIYNFRKSRHVSFPRPLYPLVHPAVLVETYEQGDSVSRYIDDNDVLEGNDVTKRALADIGTNALLKMLLVDNFIHADMHPGNILVRLKQDKPNRNWMQKSKKPHVIFLDVGMTAELSRTDQLNLREFFKAVAVRDGRSAAECTLRFSKKQSCPNPNAFIEEVEKSFTFWGTEEGDIVHPAECMHDLLEKVRRHKVNIDGNVCTVMVTTLVLEGWQRKLDPEYNVMNTLQSLLFKADWVEDLVHTINGLI
ncbi:hypothetical protein ACHQM5_017778 [Ranunculus cassubicifolius]